MVEPTHLSPPQRELLERARTLGHEVLAPIAREGEPGRVNRALVRALGVERLLDRVLPADGAGSAVELCLLREGLAHGCTEAETALALQGLGGYPILRRARTKLREQWIPRLAAGEVVAAFALSEPEAGSDAAALALRADRDGDGFRLSGTKIWISNAPEADVYTVFARTTDGARARGITAFAIPRESEGLTGTPLTLLAPHPIGRLDFDAVHAVPEQVLGEVDEGFGVAMETLDLFRPSVGAFAVGMAQAALDAAVAHAAGRRAFGRPLAEFQAVSHQLADVATRVEAARLLVHHAAAAYDAGVRPVRQAAAMAKLFATETAQQAVDVAIQVHGARALERGHLLEHLYREVRAPRIYEGASEVQREIIARELFKETA
jgi:acyl-CoA dehydrogenase